jgi:hypothetical protein
MVLLISLLLIAQGTTTSKSRWDSPDVLIEDTLGAYVDFAADYNYTTGDIYVAAAVDSGYYFGDSPGWVYFRSQDHGLTWGKIYSSWFVVPPDYLVKDVDFVVARDDTLYVSEHCYRKSTGFDLINYYKIFYVGTPYWESNFLNEKATSTAEYRSPKLVRDDFEPFYLYRAYIIDCDGAWDTIRLDRSTDKGASWANIDYGFTVQYNDCDLTVSDSTVYFTYLYYSGDVRRLRTLVYRNRGVPAGSVIIQTTADTINADIKYPRIGATTTPENRQLVYTFYSQKNSGSGNWDLLYRYSEDGGVNWSSAPDTLKKGSSSPVLCDIRGYEIGPCEYMDMAYCFTSSSPTPSFENFWCWSVEGAPTIWNNITSVSTGINSSTPELIYSPGSSASGGGVVYNDFYGNLWFDAPWYSGVPEGGDNEDKIRSQIVLAGSSVKLNSSGAIVYDVMGREIIKLNGDRWNLKDENGEEVEGGIYFIINEKTGERVKLSVIK